jgi:hypothetical protein
MGYNPATWMLEVTGGAMATLIPPNSNVDWPEHYLQSSLALESGLQADALVKQVRSNTAELTLLSMQGLRGTCSSSSSTSDVLQLLGK